MKKAMLLAMSTLAALNLGGLSLTNIAQAADFGDWMNPSKWFGGNGDRDDYGPGYYGGRGYGGPGYGYGYGAPGYAYGAPGYGHGAPARQAAPAAPAP